MKVSLGVISTNESVKQIPAELIDSAVPITDLRFRARFVHPQKDASLRVGQGNRYLPVPVELKSGGKDFGWTSLIKVSGRRVDYDSRGISVVVLDAFSGEVLDRKKFDLILSKERAQTFLDFYSKSRSLHTRPVFYIMAVHANGTPIAFQGEISEVLKELGGFGRLPRRNESFLFIGAPDLEEGQAFEEMGPRLLERSFGSRDLMAQLLIQIKSIE